MKYYKQRTLSVPPFPQLRGSLEAIKFPAFAEVKLDGEFCFVVKQGGRCCTVNKYGTVRENFPALQQIEAAVPDGTVFLAELYYGDGKLGALYDLLKHKEDDDLKLYCFDVCQLQQIPALNLQLIQDKPLIDRKELIAELFPNRPLIHNPKAVTNAAEANEWFKEIVKLGYEGIVVKSMNERLVFGPNTWVKMKFKDRNDYPIALIDPHQERIEVTVTTSKAAINVGVKCPNRYKRNLKVGDIVTIEHQGVLASGSLRHPVYVHS